MGKQLVKQRRLITNKSKQPTMTKQRTKRVVSRPKQYFSAVITNSFDFAYKGHVGVIYLEKGIVQEDEISINELKQLSKNNAVVIYEVFATSEDKREVSDILRRHGRLERDVDKIKNITLFHGTSAKTIDNIKRTGKVYGHFAFSDDKEDGLSKASFYANLYHRENDPIILEVNIPEDYVKPAKENPTNYRVARNTTEENDENWISAKYINAYWGWDDDLKEWIRHKWGNHQ
jgi:hypothetical protein